MKDVVRKYSRSKWKERPFPDGSDLSADALSSCLRTSDGKLSVWCCHDTEEDRQEAVLALATSGQHLETMDVIVLDRKTIEHEGYSLVESEAGGLSPVLELNQRHADVCELSAQKVVKFAEFLAPMIRDGSECKRYTRAQLLDLVRDAAMGGRVDLSDLHEGVRNAIRKKFPEDFP